MCCCCCHAQRTTHNPQPCRACRLPAPAPPSGELEKLVSAHAADPRVQALPEAALALATSKAAAANSPALAALATWAPAGVMEGLELMTGPALVHRGVKAYAIRCLRATPPAKVAFFLPQLVQALRGDADGTMAAFLLITAQARRGRGARGEAGRGAGA